MIFLCLCRTASRIGQKNLKIVKFKQIKAKDDVQEGWFLVYCEELFSWPVQKVRSLLTL